MLKNCAVIAFLLVSIFGLWSVYQHKQENLARLQHSEEEMPRMMDDKAEAGKDASQGMETAIVQWESEP